MTVIATFGALWSEAHQMTAVAYRQFPVQPMECSEGAFFDPCGNFFSVGRPVSPWVGWLERTKPPCRPERELRRGQNV